MKRVRAHTLNWFKRLMYNLSFHTDVNKALKWCLEAGIRIGRKQAGCPHCHTPLQETHRGTFECPLCKPTSAWSPGRGIYIARWPGHGPHGDPDATMPLPSKSAAEMVRLQEQARQNEEREP